MLKSRAECEFDPFLGSSNVHKAHLEYLPVATDTNPRSARDRLICLGRAKGPDNCLMQETQLQLQASR
jgi:hypothetical protein